MKSNLKLIFNESGKSLEIIIEDGKPKSGLKERTVDGDTYLPVTCSNFYEELLKLFNDFDNCIEIYQRSQIKGRKYES